VRWGRVSGLKLRNAKLRTSEVHKPLLLERSTLDAETGGRGRTYLSSPEGI
jgi:hypothetical protein